MRSIFWEKPDPFEARLATQGFWRQVWVWLPCVLAVGVICAESTGTFSAEHTSSWLRPIVERWVGHIRDGVWDFGHHVFRKTGHFCGYGAVCLTFLRAWLLMLARVPDVNRGVWRARSCGLAVLCTALVASGDEWHQTFLPSRTGKVSDVVLDTCGAAVSCGLVWLFVWRRQKRRRQGGRKKSLR